MMSQADSESSAFNINEDSNQSFAENSNMGFSQEQEDSNESESRSTDVRLGMLYHQYINQYVLGNIVGSPKPRCNKVFAVL